MDLRPAESWQAEAVLPPAWTGLLQVDLPLTRRQSAASTSVVQRLRPPTASPEHQLVPGLAAPRHAAHLAATRVSDSTRSVFAGLIAGPAVCTC